MRTVRVLTVWTAAALALALNGQDLAFSPGGPAAFLPAAGSDAPRAGVSRIAFLRSLLEPGRFKPTDTTTLFTVEGIVTTHVNLTSGDNALFYLQDTSAGIAVFWRGGASHLPRAGDLVRVTAPLAQFNGLLELAPVAGKAGHKVTVLSLGNPLPLPMSFEFGWQADPDYMEQMEGKYVVVSNVFLDLTTPVFSAGAAYRSVMMTNGASDTFVLFVNAQTDLHNQFKPTGPVTILGVLGQYDPTSPYTSGYELIPSRFADFQSPSKAPAIQFTNVLTELVQLGDAPTNTFSEHALRPGEQLTLRVSIANPANGPAAILPVTAGLPASAHWTMAPVSPDADLTATFTMRPGLDDVGNLYEVRLLAWNGAATNTGLWTVYVPTPEEQQLVITEFLANPTSTPTAAAFNPLRRPKPAPRPGTNDEYIELANLGSATLDLQGWTITDANSLSPRLVFYDPLELAPSNAVVVYGGPAGAFLPGLDTPAVAAQETSVGLALNNNGDAILLRNPRGYLVARVVYGPDLVAPEGAMTRYPDARGAFVPQTSVSPLPVSPGRRYDGRRFDEPEAPPAWAGALAIALAPRGEVILTWQSEPGRTYSVWSATAVEGPYTPRASGLTDGRHLEPTSDGGMARFFRVSAP